MKNKKNVIAYVLATISGICFISGFLILSK